jgi:Protein of unknown function DUF2617
MTTVRSIESHFTAAVEAKGKDRMPVEVARPDVSNLVLRSYERLLHPELLTRTRSLVLETVGMSLDIRLGPAGHALILQAGSSTLTELMAERQDPGPERGKLYEHSLKGCRTESIELETGLRYSVAYSLEKLSPTVFLRQHEEIVSDCLHASLALEASGSNRFSPGPVSLIRADVSRDSILVHAIHTFPAHLDVVKIQSLFERRSAG